MRPSVRTNVGLLDYGVGNIASLKSSLERLGYRVLVTSNEASLAKTTTIFLPGVGSFPYAMENLRSRGLDKFLQNRFEQQDVNVIGICLGMQILFDYSEEGESNGLGLIAGQVLRFKDKECHVGWNIVSPMGKGLIDEESGFYFNHSYYVDCPASVAVATSNYQRDFPVIIRHNRFVGLQFHPEKSQTTGAQLLQILVEK